jgi:hypothetical protein
VGLLNKPIIRGVAVWKQLHLYQSFAKTSHKPHRKGASVSKVRSYGIRERGPLLSKISDFSFSPGRPEWLWGPAPYQRQIPRIVLCGKSLVCDRRTEERELLYLLQEIFLSHGHFADQVDSESSYMLLVKTPHQQMEELIWMETK